jgi:hypothetical protein
MANVQESYPTQTTGLGVAAQIIVTGNEDAHPDDTTPGYNTVVLSLSGANGYPTTFQLNSVIADVSGAPVDTGTALTLTSVAASAPGSLTLSAVAASASGVAVYTGTITGGGSSAWEGYQFTVTGFTGAAAVNNGTFQATASTTTTLTLNNPNAVAVTAAGTAAAQQGTAVYTGTITGGGSNALAGQTFTIAGFVTHTSNNGTFIATGSSTTTLTLENAFALAETHAATATSEEGSTNQLTYVVYPSKTLTGNTYQPSGTSTAVASVSATGLLTALAVGNTEVETSFPTFNNSVGATGALPTTNPMHGLPAVKIYASQRVKVVA